MLQDQILSLDDLTLYENDRLMTMERGESRPFLVEEMPGVVVRLSVEVSRD